MCPIEDAEENIEGQIVVSESREAVQNISNLAILLACTIQVARTHRLFNPHAGQRIGQAKKPGPGYILQVSNLSHVINNVACIVV